MQNGSSKPPSPKRARARLAWIKAVIVKPRKATDQEARRGFLESGAPDDVATRVREDGRKRPAQPGKEAEAPQRFSPTTPAT